MTGNFSGELTLTKGLTGVTANFSGVVTANSIDLADTNGDKIAVYGSLGAANYGLSVDTGLLEVHSDSAGADVAIGSGYYGVFTETARFTGDGYYNYKRTV